MIQKCLSKTQIYQVMYRKKLTEATTARQVNAI